jgi:hypothetical protein
MTNPAYTHLAYCVDRSGSMTPIAADMEGAIKHVLAEQAALPGELHVDIWTFDTIVEHPYRDVRADDVKGQIIDPRGGTALNDTLAAVIRELGDRFKAMPEEDRPGKVIVTVVTDGQENSSREFPGPAGREAVKAMVEKQQAEWNWEFLFFGADSIDAFEAAGGYGIARGQTISFASTQSGVESAAFAASGYMTRARAGEDTEFTEEERAAAADEDATV